MRYIEFFPYPLLAGILGLAAVCLHLWKRGWLYRAGLLLLGLYLMAAINMMFFPIRVPLDWPANLSWGGTLQQLTHNINLIPGNYAGMLAHLRAGELNPRVVLVEIAGNVLFTVPFGLGIRALTRLQGRRLAWLALGTGLVLEGAQLILRLVVGFDLHSVDVNDVLLNALGVGLGYGIYQAAVWAWQWGKAALGRA
ncbi:MAG: VanZ family protein [Anaerolineaceae bacterium]|nr:VanZ family protein [Anaerolineaceae bacterium]